MAYASTSQQQTFRMAMMLTCITLVCWCPALTTLAYAQILPSSPAAEQLPAAAETSAATPALTTAPFVAPQLVGRNSPITKYSRQKELPWPRRPSSQAAMRAVLQLYQRKQRLMIIGAATVLLLLLISLWLVLRRRLLEREQRMWRLPKGQFKSVVLGYGRLPPRKEDESLLENDDSLPPHDK